MRIVPKLVLISLAASLALPLSARTENAPPAASVLKDAFARAAKDKKVAMVGFHASWCHWCHEMEKVMNRPEIKPIFDKYFVVTWLVVDEQGDKANLMNPGADEIRKANGGANQGIPFFYFADPKTGKTIINSMRPSNGADKGGNTGCPAEPLEIEHFLAMVKKAVPKITDAEIKTLEAGFKTVKGG